MLVVSQAILVVDVARVWWSYHVHVEYRITLSLCAPRTVSVKASSAAAAKASGAPEAPFCKACRNMEKIGKQNGEAHLRVPPCCWARKAPAPRKKRALETPAAAASGTKGDVAESEAERALAVTCSSASVLWD